MALVQGVEQAAESHPESAVCFLHLVLVVRPIDALAENMPEALLVTGAEGYLTQTANRVEKDHPGVSVSWEVVTGFDVANTLVSIAEGTKSVEGQHVVAHSRDVTGGAPLSHESGAYTLLVMATHGRTGIMRWLWGSITERVVATTELPLLLVRPNKPV